MGHSPEASGIWAPMHSTQLAPSPVQLRQPACWHSTQSVPLKWNPVAPKKRGVAHSRQLDASPVGRGSGAGGGDHAHASSTSIPAACCPCCPLCSLPCLSPLRSPSSRAPSQVLQPSTLPAGAHVRTQAVQSGWMPGPRAPACTRRPALRSSQCCHASPRQLPCRLTGHACVIHQAVASATLGGGAADVGAASNALAALGAGAV